MKPQYIIAAITGIITCVLLYQGFALESACTPLLAYFAGCPNPFPWFASAFFVGVVSVSSAILAALADSPKPKP